MAEKQIVKIVKVLFLLTNESIDLHGFKLNTIVSLRQEYGIVSKLKQSDRPIIITWDSDCLYPFAYTLDEIRVLKIRAIAIPRINRAIAAPKTHNSRLTTSLKLRTNDG